MPRFSFPTAAALAALLGALSVQPAVAAGDSESSAAPGAQSALDADMSTPASAKFPATGAAVESSAASDGVRGNGSVRVELITNGPVPDTPANRALYGGPVSHAGRLTDPIGD